MGISPNRVPRYSQPFICQRPGDSYLQGRGHRRGLGRCAPSAAPGFGTPPLPARLSLALTPCDLLETSVSVPPRTVATSQLCLLNICEAASLDWGTRLSRR